MQRRVGFRHGLQPRCLWQVAASNRIQHWNGCVPEEHRVHLNPSHAAFDGIEVFGHLEACRKEEELLVVCEEDSNSSGRHHAILVPAADGSVAGDVEQRFHLVNGVVTESHIVAKQGFAVHKEQVLDGVQAIHEEVLAEGSQDRLGQLRLSQAASSLYDQGLGSGVICHPFGHCGRDGKIRERERTVAPGRKVKDLWFDCSQMSLLCFDDHFRHTDLSAIVPETRIVMLFLLFAGEFPELGLIGDFVGHDPVRELGEVKLSFPLALFLPIFLLCACIGGIIGSNLLQHFLLRHGVVGIGPEEWMLVHLVPELDAGVLEHVAHHCSPAFCRVGHVAFAAMIFGQRFGNGEVSKVCLHFEDDVEVHFWFRPVGLPLLVRFHDNNEFPEVLQLSDPSHGVAEHVRHLLSCEIIWDVFFASLSQLRISEIFPRSGKCPHEIPASMVSLHFLFLFMLGGVAVAYDRLRLRLFCGRFWWSRCFALI